MKILVVDDERDIEILFKLKFRKEIKDKKIEFHFSFSAEDAIEFLGRSPKNEVVLILSDINMPGMNGLELLKIIKETFPHLFVFMITAYDDEDKHKKADEYGADSFITKPIDFELLKNEIYKLNI